MTEPKMGIGAITLFVEDVPRSKEFYARVFELPQIFEDEVSAVFQFDNTIVNLLKSTEADEVIAPAKVGTNSGSRFQLTIWVDGADAAAADLEARGVKLVNGPLDREWGQRTACFADPDGHLWELAQHLS